MADLWSRGGLSWRELFHRVAREVWRDEVFGQAARLAFYLFLALVPTLLLLWLALTALAASGLELRQALSETLNRILPQQGSADVSSALRETGSVVGFSGVALAVAAALWAALHGMWAVITALNKAYEVKEGRPVWRTYLVAAWLAAVWAVLALAALVLVLFGARIRAAMGGGAWRVIWPALHWAIAVAALLVAFSILYRFGPHLEDAEMRWSTPGAVIGAALWIASALGFRLYLQHSNSYHRIYGHLGGVAILLLWLYVSGAAILIGGVVNAEIEHAAAAAGDPRARAPGERRVGESSRRPAA